MPRFMLRNPYGEKSDPIDKFDFEEFTPNEGLRGDALCQRGGSGGAAAG